MTFPDPDPDPDPAVLRLAVLALAILLSIVLAPHANAQEVTLEAEIESVGFENTVADESWTPVRVRLVAPAGSRPVSGRIVTQPVAFESVCASEAPFSVVPTNDAKGEVSVLLALPPHTELGFTLRVEDERGHELALLSPRFLPSKIAPGERLALVVPGGVQALGSAPPRPQPGPQPPPGVRVARVAADALPARSWLLLGASAVFLKHDKEHPEIHALARDPERVAALADLVRSGRSLVVVGSGVAFWRETPLDELLPVDAAGELRAAEPTELDFLGPRSSESPEATLSRATVRPGSRALVGTDERPLVAVRDLGRGHVCFLAFDPDAPALRGATALPSFLDGLVPQPGEVARHVRFERIAETSKEIFCQRSPLGVVGLGALSLAAVAVVVVLGPFAAHRRLSPLRTFAAPLLAAGLGCAIVLVSWASRPRDQANVLVYAFSESSRGDALAVTDAGLYASEETTFELELVGNARLVPLERQKLELLDFRSHGRVLRLAHGGAPRVTPIETPALGLAWIRASSTLEVPPSARVTAEATQDAVLVTALAGDVPAGGLAFRAGSILGSAVEPLVVPLGAIRRGETRSVAFDRAHGARTLGELLREREDEKLPLWDRDPESARASYFLLALKLINDECAVTPRKDEEPFPRTWVALPGTSPELVRASSQGKPVPGKSLAVFLVAAEERP